MVAIPFFTILSGLNGYKNISDSVYYPLAATSGLVTFWRASAKYDNLPLHQKTYRGPLGHFGVVLLATGLGMTISGVLGHYTGRAIREVMHSERPPAT